MRTFLAGAIAALLGFAHMAPQPTITLAGTVTTGSGPTLRPVRHAKVTLTGRGLVRILDTDTKGMYRVDRLPDGPYRLAVERPGFVKLVTDAMPNATLQMERAGAIEGTVITDAGGDPVMNVVVSALQPGADGAKPKIAATTRTDDLGRYRLHSLAAGEYIVEVATDQTFVFGQFVMPGQRRAEIRRSYYSGVDRIEDARPVRVAAGREASGVELVFTPNQPAADPSAPPPPPRDEPTGTGRIAGRVVDAVSGRGIRGAQLLLLPAEGMGLTNGTSTDARGRFEYKNLSARKYTLRAQADRFITLAYGQRRPGESGTIIDLAEGQDFPADMALARGSAVEGTLLDEFGDPAPTVMVQVARKQYVAGRQRLLPMSGRVQPLPSDDRGHYRIFGLEPGDYYVVALSGAFSTQNEVGGFAPTYYPGTPDSGAALPVTVPFGADASNTSFALTAAKTFAIAGTMVDESGKAIAGSGTVWLVTPDRLRRMDFHLARGLTSIDGTFVLRNVPQGEYTLQGFGVPPPSGRGPGNLGALPFGWLPVAVGDSDLDGVILRVTNGTTLRGKIAFDDATASPPRPEQVHVTAFPVEFDSASPGGGPPPSETHEDWTFEVSRLSGQRRIFVIVASPGWALKKITSSGIDVTDGSVDLRTKDVEDVEVLLTPKVARVSGTASGDNGRVTDYAAVIFSSDPTKWIDRSRFVVVARPTQQGRFSIMSLPPDDYLAVALPGVVGTEWTDPEFLQQLRPLATAFSLQEGESKTLDLKLKKRP